MRSAGGWASRALVADRGYDPEFGARPLRRTIQRLVENEVSNRLLDGRLGPGGAVQVGVEDGKLQFDVQPGDGLKEEDSISLEEEAPSRT
jgi:ATP-dependent Clp protease ATP-binding subunit ClpC